MTDNVMDLKNMADRIGGLDNLMAAASDLQDEPEPNELDRLRKMNEKLEEHIKFLERKILQLHGKIDGLEFALRCNGISGADVR